MLITKWSVMRSYSHPSHPGFYQCPLYYYPNRGDLLNNQSFVLPLDLKTGSKPPEHWTKRAVGALLSLDH